MQHTIEALADRQDLNTLVDTETASMLAQLKDRRFDERNIEQVQRKERI